MSEGWTQTCKNIYSYSDPTINCENRSFKEDRIVLSQFLAHSHWKAAKMRFIALPCVLSTCLRVPTQEPLNKFSLNLILGSFTKICWPISFGYRQQYPTTYVKTYMHFDAHLKCDLLKQSRMALDLYLWSARFESHPRHR
jgi:hypothetical protein